MNSSPATTSTTSEDGLQAEDQQTADSTKCCLEMAPQPSSCPLEEPRLNAKLTNAKPPPDSREAAVWRPSVKEGWFDEQPSLLNGLAPRTDEGRSDGPAARSAVSDTKMDTGSIRKLVAPLSKEQLIEILVRASHESRVISDMVVSIAECSPSTRRIMIRNINYETSDSAFVAHFRQFGELEDAAIVREKNGRSKGFGFVTFKKIHSMNLCLKSSLYLDGRKLFVKVAADPFSEFLSDGAPIQGQMSRRKIFIRNLPTHECDNGDTLTQELHRQFSQFGPIEDCSVVKDHNGRPRGFAFITFLNQEGAVKASAEPQQTFMGRVIFVSIAKSGAKRVPNQDEWADAEGRLNDSLDEKFKWPPADKWVTSEDTASWSQTRDVTWTQSTDMAGDNWAQPRDEFPASASAEPLFAGLPAGEAFAHYASLYPYSAAAAAAAYKLITQPYSRL